VSTWPTFISRSPKTSKHVERDRLTGHHLALAVVQPCAKNHALLAFGRLHRRQRLQHRRCRLVRAFGYRSPHAQEAEGGRGDSQQQAELQ
jgi:hypothetical protein